MRNRAFTLIELLMAMAIFGVLFVAMGRVYVATIDQDSRVQAGRETVEAQRNFEARVSNLFRHAYLSTDTTNTASYFVGTETGNGVGTLAFTTLGDRPNSQFLTATETDFETLNQEYGPQGGVNEVSLSLTAVGTAPVDGAMYLREQRPADGDPEQGGYESVMLKDVSDLNFEFWDGTAWVTAWDTREQTTARLPAAVRLTYRLSSETEDRVMVMRLPASDVTADNPLEEETTE